MKKLQLFNELGQELDWKQVFEKIPKEHLRNLIKDAMLAAEYQDNWNDNDTCELIVYKIINNDKLDFLK